MNVKNYNIFFHLHTVSGIIISALLYVIFFAGSFSFFRDDINNWERNQGALQKESEVVNDEILLNYDEALNHVARQYNLYSSDVWFRQSHIERNVSVSVTPAKDTLVAKQSKVPGFFYLDSKNYSISNYTEQYQLGEFLYRLHFFTQIPYPYGYHLAGFVALFFLFAIVTGVLVHWKKIVSNFYVFRPKAKLKTIWTDAHTALGILGVPFQFVLSVTGAFFMIKGLLLFPGISVLYDGNANKLYQDFGYSEVPIAYNALKLEKTYSINDYVEQTEKRWKGFHATSVYIRNYGDTSMEVKVGGELLYKDQLSSSGHVVYKVETGEEIAVKDPLKETTYTDVVKNLLYRLHFGDYGGYGLRVVSFILGIITCFVIISGVLIWLVAREKKSIPEKKKRFNRRLVNVYLAVCLSMYPVTALAFIAVKLNSMAGQAYIYKFYFLTWLGMSIFFILKNDDYKTNRITLFLGSVIGFLIPFVNGAVTGNWFWIAYQKDLFSVFFIDAFWMVLSIITFLVWMKIRRKGAKL